MTRMLVGPHEFIVDSGSRQRGRRVAYPDEMRACFGLRPAEANPHLYNERSRRKPGSS